MKNEIVRGGGSVQAIERIPASLRRRYRTVWEMSMRPIIDQAADRGAYICQSQSMNLFIASPNAGSVNSMHFYAWEKGLKTGMYYLRSKPASAAKAITVEAAPEKKSEEEEQAALLCSLENPEACEMCGS
jgi:ribonucleoside-diphosphate reductase alpha chain